MRFLGTILLLIVAACAGGGAAPAPSAAGTSPPAARQQLLVMLEHPDDPAEIDDIRDDFGLVAIERIGQTSFFVVEVGPGTDLDKLLRDLGDDGRVVVSEPDYLAESPEGGPTDIAITGTDLLSSITTQPGLSALDLAGAHSVSTGAGVLVAVVDTGVDFTHPFLAGRVDAGGFDFIGQDLDPSEERNFTDDDLDGVADDQFGHGTFVASLIVAVAPDARILPVRVLDDEGFGTASTVAAGIVWAVDAGAQVVNVSVDIPSASGIMRDAIGYAEDRDVVVVAAAGNGGGDGVIFPARFSDVVAIAATDASGVLAPFSNVGSSIGLVAPGVDLLGAVPATLNPTFGTARWSGTSFAAPLVAGSAALVRAAFPFFSREDVDRRLQDTAAPVDALNPNEAGRVGAGLVQPALAVQ